LFELLGQRSSGAPNIADADSATSVALAAAILERLGVTRTSDLDPQSAGRALEQGVEAELQSALPRLRPERSWMVDHRRVVSDFDQYAHLAKLQELIDADASGTLSVEIGRDYLIKPDVTVAIETGFGLPLLHAAVSCKWTIRSDRVQNIRHEGIVLTRHRRGRQPHIVTVTPEPLADGISGDCPGNGRDRCRLPPTVR
jgi:NgoMIV restriction enzyme